MIEQNKFNLIQINLGTSFAMPYKVANDDVYNINIGVPQDGASLPVRLNLERSEVELNARASNFRPSCLLPSSSHPHAPKLI